MSETTTTTYELTTTDVFSVLSAFSEGDDVIARRIFTVGALCNEHGITPKQVFESVTAESQLIAGTDDEPRIVKGFSSSSVANAKTSFDLYVMTGVSTTKGKKSDRDYLAGLIEDVRRIHGSKIVKTTIVDAVSVFTETITPDERYDGVTTILRALKGIPAAEKKNTETTPEDRFLSALRSALALSATVELTDEQASAAADLIGQLADLGI